MKVKIIETGEILTLPNAVIDQGMDDFEYTDDGVAICCKDYYDYCVNGGLDGQ